MVVFTFGVGLLSSVKSLWEVSHRCPQRCVSKDFKSRKASHHNPIPSQLDILLNCNLPKLVLKRHGCLIMKDAFSPSLSVPNLLAVLKMIFIQILL